MALLPRIGHQEARWEIKRKVVVFCILNPEGDVSGNDIPANVMNNQVFGAEDPSVDPGDSGVCSGIG